MDEAGKFVWNELMTPDVEGARTFYGKLFGWEAQTTPMPGPDGAEYTGFMLGGTPVGGAFAPPEVGRIAVLQDPAGAVFAVIAPAPELLAGG